MSPHAMPSRDRFARALLDPALPAPVGLTSWNGSDTRQRFAIYRNNVVVSLVGALEATFPVVRELVGEAFFRDMARVFAQENPPRSRLMFRYGAEFPAFLERFAPVRSLPYLADVAQLEAARVAAHHAADAHSLGAEGFAALSGDGLDDLCMRLHPTVHVLSSRYAVFSLWAAHQGALDIGDVDPFEPEDALAVRPAHDVLILRLPPGCALFLERLATGCRLADAAIAASEAAPDFDLSTTLHVVIANGLATSLFFHGDKDHERPARR